MSEEIGIEFEPIGILPGTAVPYYHSYLYYTGVDGARTVLSLPNTTVTTAPKLEAGPGHRITLFGQILSIFGANVGQRNLTTGPIIYGNLSENHFTLSSGNNLSDEWLNLKNSMNEFANPHFSYGSG